MFALRVEGREGVFVGFDTLDGMEGRKWRSAGIVELKATKPPL